MGYYTKPRRKTRILPVLRVLTLVAVITTLVFGGRMFYNKHKIQSLQNDITVITQKNNELKGQTEKLRQELESIESEKEELDDTLSRFQPIVIPESMK